MPNGELLTTSQVATMIGKTRWTVWRLIQSGDLIADQLGGPNGTHLIARSEVDRYLGGIEDKGTAA